MMWYVYQNFSIWIVVLETCDADQFEKSFIFSCHFEEPKSFQLFPSFNSNVLPWDFPTKKWPDSRRSFFHGQVVAGRQHRLAKPGSHGSFWRSPTTLDAGPCCDGMVIFPVMLDVKWWQVARCLQNMHLKMIQCKVGANMNYGLWMVEETGSSVSVWWFLVISRYLHGTSLFGCFIYLHSYHCKQHFESRTCPRGDTSNRWVISIEFSHLFVRVLTDDYRRNSQGPQPTLHEALDDLVLQLLLSLQTCCQNGKFGLRGPLEHVKSCPNTWRFLESSRLTTWVATRQECSSHSVSWLSQGASKCIEHEALNCWNWHSRIKHKLQHKVRGFR